MSHRLSDHRERFKNTPGPIARSTKVACCKCKETIAAYSDECPFCEFIFSGGTARDYAPEAGGQFARRARRKHLLHVVVVILLVLGLGGLSVISLLMLFH